jgi:sphingomyelin phosphodiesterase
MLFLMRYSKEIFCSQFFKISSLNPPPSFLVWTGDNPPHDVWDETAEGQLNRLKIVSQMISQAFPTLPVFPVLGNHDSFPVDQYSRLPVDSAHHDNFDWLMDGLTSFWGQWISKESISTFMSGGYYTELAQTGNPIIKKMSSELV